MVSHGVYFLANDRVLELAIAFLNSFRRYNPDIPLCWVPFNSDNERVLRLQTQYDFSILDKPDQLTTCDKISTRFHGQVLGEYRKLAMWEGDFERFLYIDVDTVVLANIDFVFQYLDDYEFVTSHSNLPHIEKFVWKGSIYTAGALEPDQIAFAANTGFVASRRRVLTLQQVGRQLEEALAIARHMQLEFKDQALLNYLIVTSGLRYTSLLVLCQSKGVHPEDKLELWAGSRGRRVRKGQVIPPALLVHWAGEWQPRWIDYVVHNALRALGLVRANDRPLRIFFLPYDRLWRYYRHLHKRRPRPHDGIWQERLMRHWWR